MANQTEGPNVFHDEPQWNSSPAWKLPGWAEPVMVASILVASMVLTRKRGFKVLGKNRRYDGFLNGVTTSARSSSDLETKYMLEDDSSDDNNDDSTRTLRNPPKKRSCCGIVLYTPNSSRFSHHLHSRIMQKFPFLMEMFYWIITYAFYRSTALLSQAIFSKTGIWDVAQNNALEILRLEHQSWLKFLWPVHENEVQQWFMNGHQTFLTILNRSYALIHIPGTVGFIAWYYHAAPSHAIFATVRRTMTLTNLLAFSIFIIYPCMPPRLLPREYGFLDSVGHNNAQSVWMSGKYVNSLAAMPSMHFGYAFCIGCTVLHHSGISRMIRGGGKQRGFKIWTFIHALFAIWYPSWILLTIVATANHYYLDAFFALIVVIFAYLCNEILMLLIPLEDLLLWCLRLEKPKPTTGDSKLYG